MRTIRLEWKPQVPKKQKAATVTCIRKHYKEVKDCGDHVRLKAPNDDTKFIWLFMLSGTFRSYETII